jgi:hypothetical protein
VHWNRRHPHYRGRKRAEARKERNRLSHVEHTGASDSWLSKAYQKAGFVRTRGHDPGERYSCLGDCQNRWFLERVNGVNPVLMQYVSHLLECHFVDLRNPALVDAK